MTAVARPGRARADEGSHGAGRRRAAAARARVGQGGRSADPVHPRLVAEPSLLGQAVRARSPTSSGSSPTTSAVTACPRRRSSPSTTPTASSGPTTSRRSSTSSVSTGRCSSAGPTAPSSSATTCARTARTEIAAINFVEGAVKLGEAAFGTLIGPGFLDHFADATADDLPTNIRAMRAFVGPASSSRCRTTISRRRCVLERRRAGRIRANLAAREIDCDDVLRAPRCRCSSPRAGPTRSCYPRWPSTSSPPARPPRPPGTKGVGHVPHLEEPERFNDMTFDTTSRLGRADPAGGCGQRPHAGARPRLGLRRRPGRRPAALRPGRPRQAPDRERWPVRGPAARSRTARRSSPTRATTRT